MNPNIKHRLVLITTYICYWFGFDFLFYFLNRKSKRIITFHNILPNELLPYGRRIGIVDDCESFRAIIREIGRRYKFSNDLNDVSTVTMTFDDGYKNQVECAAKILEEEGNIPAYIFLSGQLKNNSIPEKALTVDLLLHWVHLAPNGCYNINGQSFEMMSDNRDTIWSTIIWPAFCQDNETKGIELLAALDNLYGVRKIHSHCSAEYLRLRLTGITDDEVTYLKKLGILVGWHTQTHYPLSHLNSFEQAKEIYCPYQEMRKLPFSYPYGENSSVNDDSKTIAANMKYPCAVSNMISGDNQVDEYYLPRMSLSANKYLLHFELSGLKYFLQHWALLPKFPLS